jgi:Xaa-Pro aminopeptidase
MKETERQKPGYRQYREEYIKEFPKMYKHTPQPSLEERDRRWGRIREEMTLWNLDCLLVWGSDAMFTLCEANFRYVTAIPATMARCVTVFPRKGEPIAFVGTPHDNYEGACYAWVKDVRPFPKSEDVTGVMKELGFEKARIGNVGDMQHYWPFVMQYQIWTDIQKSLPEVRFIDAAPLLWGVSMIKSPEEIALTYEAGRIAGLVYEALVNAAKPGVMECEVYAEMLRALVANGGEPNSMFLMDSGNPVFAHPRHPPMSMRRLEKGDIIVVEYHTKYAGYHTHTERAVSLGPPSQETMKLFDICKEAYYIGLEKMRPGANFSDAVNSIREPLRRNGMVDIECGFHSHGSTSGGYPSFNDPDDRLGEIENVTIRENQILTHQIDIFNPSWPNGGGMVLGDSFVVTDSGAKVFAKIPVEIAVV